MAFVAAGFAGGLVLLAPAIAWAERLGLVDRPNARGSHRRATPRVGGFALLGALSGGTIAALGSGAFAGIAAAGLAFALPAVGFLAIGLLDDRVRLRPAGKGLAQAACAALAVGLGWRFAGEAAPGFVALSFGVLDPIAAWLWIVAVVTLVNFMDGIDLITCAVWITPLAIGAGYGAGVGDGALYATLVGGVLVLALANATPARTFPGDGATHLLGFAIALLPMRNLGGGIETTPLPWAWAAAPLLPATIDVLLGLIAKRRRGMSWGAPHREHLHQRLTRAGSTHAASALRYGLLSAIAAWFAIDGIPRLGWGVAGPLAATLLATHLLQAWRATRRVAWSGSGDTVFEASEDLA